jgi:hypothetical protein
MGKLLKNNLDIVLAAVAIGHVIAIFIIYGWAMGYIATAVSKALTVTPQPPESLGINMDAARNILLQRGLISASDATSSYAAPTE